MNRHFFTSMGLALVLSSSAFATGIDGAYLRVGGGVSKVEDQNHSYTNNTNIINQLDSGRLFGLAIGFRFNDYWRGDISWDRADNDNDMATINSVQDGSTGGRLSYKATMLNFFYDFSLDNFSKWRPYLGAGAGLGRIKWALNDTSTTATARTDRATFQGTIGAGYEFNQNWRLNINYRRVETSPYASQTGAGISSNSNPKYRNNNANVEVMFVL
jgi:opacity protein-like surface antigen